MPAANQYSMKTIGKKMAKSMELKSSLYDVLYDFLLKTILLISEGLIFMYSKLQIERNRLFVSTNKNKALAKKIQVKYM